MKTNKIRTISTRDGIARLCLVITLALLACSCRSVKQQTFTHQTKTFIQETIRDSIVIIPTDQSTFRASLDVDSLGKILIKEVLRMQVGKRAQKPQVHIHDQILEVDCICDSANIYLRWKETHVTNMLSETVFMPIQKKLNVWQQIQTWLWKLLLLIVVSGIIILFLIRRIV